MLQSRHTVTQLLQALITPASNATVQQVTAALAQLEKQDQFVEVLVSITLDASLEDNLRLAAAAYLKKCAGTVAQVSLPQKLHFAEQILNVVSSQLPLKLRKIALAALELLLSKDKDQTNSLRSSFFTRFVERLAIQITNQAPLVFSQYECLALCGQLLMMMRYDKLTFNLVAASAEYLVELFGRSCDLVVGVLDQQKANSLQPASMHHLQTLNEFGVLMKSLFKNEDLPNNPVFIKLLNSQRLSDTVTKVLMLQSPSNILPISTIQINELKETQFLNNIKANTIFCLEVLLRSAWELTKREQLKDNVFLVYCPAYIKLFMASMMAVLARAPPSKIKGTLILKCMQEMMTCISIAVEVPQYYELFSAHREDWLKGCLMPFFEVGEDIVKQFNSEPQHFVDYVYQMMNRGTEVYSIHRERESQDKVLHIISAKLLVRLCIYIDGTLLETFNICMNILNTAESLPAHKHQALVVLGVISARASDRKDLVMRLFEYFEIALDVLEEESTLAKKIESCLQFMVISKYLYSFKGVQESFWEEVLQLCMNILRGNFAPARGNPALNIVNLSLLEQLSKLTIKGIEEKSAEVMSCLIPLINSPQTSRHLFTAMLDFLRDSPQIHNHADLVILCVRELITKIMSEVEKGTGTGKGSNNIREFCWNIIRLIGCNLKLKADLIPAFENELLRLMGYLKAPCKVTFDEDIELLFINFIQQARQVTDAELTMVQHFPGLLQKHKGNFYRMYNLINLMLEYGSDKITGDLFGILLETCMMAVRKPKDHYSSEVENGKGLMLLQGLMAECTSSFSKEMWISVIKYLLSRLLDPNDIEKCFLQELLASALSLAFALSFKMVEGEPFVEEVMDMVLAECRKIEKQYPRKVYSISLSQLINLYAPTNLVASRLIEILYNSITMLSNTKQISKFHQKTMNDEDEDDYDEDFSDDEEEYLKASTILSNRITKANAFDYFKAAIGGFKASNPTEWANLIGRLEDDTKHKLKIILRVEMLESGPREIVRVRRS